MIFLIKILAKKCTKLNCNKSNSYFFPFLAQLHKTIITVILKIPLCCIFDIIAGVNYALGAALVMEGVMSAVYHVCPTTISFQFDTTFMYLIAILIYIKMYQNRHPDISLNASTAFLILGLALILEAFSIYFSTATFWVIFCLIYMLSLVCLISNAYQLNTVRRGEGGGGKKGSTIIRVAKLLASETLKAGRKLLGRKVPKVRNLLVFMAVTFLLNVAMCIFFAVKAGVGGGEGASNYLLMMFMANMGIYVLYYIVMKKISNEQLCSQAKLYLGKSLCKLSNLLTDPV